MTSRNVGRDDQNLHLYSSELNIHFSEFRVLNIQYRACMYT